MALDRRKKTTPKKKSKSITLRIIDRINLLLNSDLLKRFRKRRKKGEIKINVTHGCGFTRKPICVK